MSRTIKKPTIKTGQTTARWINTRRKLKKTFEAMGVTRCELCGSDSAYPLLTVLNAGLYSISRNWNESHCCASLATRN